MHGGECKHNEEERETCHDALLSVKECAGEENVNRERMEGGCQRQPREEECYFERMARNTSPFIVLCLGTRRQPRFQGTTADTFFCHDRGPVHCNKVQNAQRQ